MRCVSHCHVNIPSRQGGSRADLNLRHLGQSQFSELLPGVRFPLGLVLRLFLTAWPPNASLHSHLSRRNRSSLLPPSRRSP